MRNESTVHDSSLHYIETGRGPLVVFVHGSLSDHRYWAAQMQPFAAHCRTVSVSLRHHYPAVWDGQSPDYGVSHHAADLAKLIATLDSGGGHIVAHSRGAHVAVILALARPELVRSLTLADPAIPLPQLASESGAKSTGRKFALERIRSGDIDGGLEAFIDAVSGSGVWKRLNSRRRQMARDNALTLPAQFADVESQRPLETLSSLRVPVLLIGGERSPPPYPATIKCLERILPDVCSRVIQRTSHSMNAEDPVGFNSIVLEFIRQQEEERLS